MKNTQANSSTQASFLDLSPVAHKKVQLSFDGAAFSSDGGALLLREIEKQTGILHEFAQAIQDKRDSRYIEHTVLEMLTQRVMQIACGYDDGNDCNHLRHDPVFKMATDRPPQLGNALASQPTQCRFENSISSKQLYKLAEVLIEHFIKSYATEPGMIVLDFDDTEDRVHGGQQLALFNGFFNEYCFMPLHVYDGLTGKLVTTILRPGKRINGKQTRAILKRLVSKLRQAWPHTVIVFRGDSHFASPEVFQWIEAQANTFFVTGLSGNNVLQTEIKHVVDQAQKRFDYSRKDIRIFHSFFYKAGSWDKPRRVIAKIEISEKGQNIRFIVTDLLQAKATVLYQDVYCARGKAELYIKEHKLYLKSDRTSCSRFFANQFRLFLHSVAYVLMHSLRANMLKNTQWANATFETIRLRFLKIGTHVRELKTRIKIQYPASCPVKMEMQRCFQIVDLLRSSA